jgi:hypothetical protein
MSRLPLEQCDSLRAAIYSQDLLRHILSRIEHLQRVEFHAQRLQGDRVRTEAEEILIADIVTRFQGRVEDVQTALHKLELGGKSRQQAVSEYAMYIHNYYTMPLGVILRKHMFGRDETMPARNCVTELAEAVVPRRGS